MKWVFFWMGIVFALLGFYLGQEWMGTGSSWVPFDRASGYQSQSKQGAFDGGAISMGIVAASCFFSSAIIHTKEFSIRDG